jgi:hypothetical protein
MPVSLMPVFDQAVADNLPVREISLEVKSHPQIPVPPDIFVRSNKTFGFQSSFNQ